MDMLRNIPLYDLPDHVLNLHHTILAPFNGSSLDYTQELTQAKNILSSHLKFLPLQPSKASKPRYTTIEDLRRLTLPARYELLHWMRRSLLSSVSAHGANISHAQRVKSAPPFLDSGDYNLLCSILEQLGDYTFLADVLCIFAHFGELSLLTGITELGSKHFEIFRAIGAAPDIYEVVLERFQDVRTRSGPDKPLITALIDITRLFPKRKKTLNILERELILCEPKPAWSACSPDSDNMGELSQEPDFSFFEEFELLYNTDTAIDRSTISRIFTNVTERLEAAWMHNVPSMASLIDILAKLYAHDSRYVEELFLVWLAVILQSKRPLDFRAILAMFLCRGLIRLPSLIKKLLADSGQSKHIPTSSLLAILALFGRNFEHCHHSVGLQAHSFSTLCC